MNHAWVNVFFFFLSSDSTQIGDFFVLYAIWIVVVVLDFIISFGESQQALPFYWEPYLNYVPCLHTE